ncbi:hypothetical protein [Thermofilum sp.]|uniref:hypothetical protein n=1 Tax=Thermofilum sp. TaxID=1961369 RepID=UPI003178C329
MIVFVPTPPPPEKWPPGIEFGVLTTMSFPVSVPKYVDKAFVDLSLRRARVGVEFHDYAKFIGKVRAKAPWAELWIVFPDAYCNATETRRNYDKFKKLASLVSPPKKYIYVAQEFASDLPEDADVVALPARRQCYTNCSREYNICVARIVAYVRNYVQDRRWIHLLGPSLRVLRAVHHLADSFDTASYRRAVDKELKQMMGGKWQATKDVMEVFLFWWLEKALGKKLTFDKPNRHDSLDL